MSTNNPISGHTDGTNDGLKDGDHILSPSLTNLYEGVHGNGILLPHDTAYGDSDRNDPPDLPGSISAGAAANQFVVKACDVILDGVLYAIGGGSDITVTLNLTGTAEMLGSFTALSSGQECLFVVIATPDGLKVSQTTNITTAVGAYPSITGSATAYLKTGSGAGDNRQSVVLGTVRATNAGGSTVGTLNIESLSEFNDKRVFVRPTPLYLSPVRDGTISSTTGINGHTALSQVHTGQTGTFGDNGIIWQSFNSAGESMLYYSAKAGANRHTHLLGPTNIDVSSPGSNQTFTFDGDRVFVLTPSSTINLNPSGTFPPGHSVFVSVPSGSTVTFDSTGLNQAITAGDAIMFAYDGTNWKRVLFSSTVATTSSGTSGLVQLSDGAGGFTSDSTLSYDTAANELTVDGKLTVTGLIDPTGLELAPQGANPGGVADNTLWLDSAASNRPKVGSSAVMRAGDDISELNNDANFVDAAGAAAAASTDLAYDAGTRTVSSSTGTNAVITEVVAGGNSGLMTGADKTKLDGVAPSATAYADADAIAAVEGEATLDLTGDVTIAAGKGLTVDTDTLHVDASNNRVGIRTSSPASELHVEGASNPTIRVQETGQTGYLESTSVVDSQARIKAINNTASEPVTLDISPVTTSTGTEQNIRVFRDSDAAVDGNFRILRVGTTDSVVHVYSDKDGTDHKMTMDGKVGIGTTSPDAPLHVETSGTGDAVIIESTDTGGGGLAPDLVLKRNTSVASEELGNIRFLGLDSGAAEQEYADLYAGINDNTAGSESGEIFLRTIHNGGTTLTRRIDITKNEVVINEDSIDSNFRVESNGDANMLFVDAGNDRVGIGTDNPTKKLEVKGDVHLSRQATTGETRVLSLEGARNATGNDYARIDFENYDSNGPTSYTGARISVKNEADGVNDGSMLFYTSNNAAALTERMRITDSGEIGIANASPAQALDVTGTIRQSAVTNAVLVADGNGDLTAASTLADVAYVLSGQAGADVYNPANPANWVGAPPLTIEQAIQRIAAVVAGQHGAIP